MSRIELMGSKGIPVEKFVNPSHRFSPCPVCLAEEQQGLRATGLSRHMVIWKTLEVNPQDMSYIHILSEIQY